MDQYKLNQSNLKVQWSPYQNYKMKTWEEIFMLHMEIQRKKLGQL